MAVISWGKTVTYSGQYSTFVASNLVLSTDPTVDGSGWNAGGYPVQWITIDLGALNYLSMVRVYHAGVVTTYNVQLSTNNSTWDTPATGVQTIANQWITTTVSGNYRYVRIYVTDATSQWVSLRRVEVSGWLSVAFKKARVITFAELPFIKYTGAKFFPFYNSTVQNRYKQAYRYIQTIFKRNPKG
jgi:hypothetical protein